MRNDAVECELHGEYDVWVMQDGKLLVTDLGFPSEEPKQCLALGVNLRLATQIAEEKSQHLDVSVFTTERKCLRCKMNFWISQHDRSFVAPETGRGYFCSACIRRETERSIADKLGILGYWCG